MKSYSHPATKQDLWAVEVLRDRLFDSDVKEVRALELGGYDGITHSNTLLLEQEWGVQCALIEAVPDFVAKMRANRPKAYCLSGAVEIYHGDTHMYVNGEWSGIPEHMSESCRQGHRMRKSPIIDFVPCAPLVDYVGPVHYDYVSIDTEGSEYRILLQWFRDGGSCDALTVEFNYDPDKYYRLCHLCEAHGMELDQVCGFDLCFLKKGIR